MWRCFHPQLPPPPGVKSEGGGVPTTSTAGLLEVEALPRKRGEGEEGRGSLGWATSRSMALASEQLTSAPENHCVRHFQIHGH